MREDEVLAASSKGRSRVVAAPQHRLETADPKVRD